MKKKQVKRRTRAQEIWHRLLQNKGAVIGMIFLTVLVLAAALSPVIFDYETDVIGQNISERLMHPCAAHPFGTDEVGRDLFARVIYGARYSLAIGVGAVLLGVLETLVSAYISSSLRDFFAFALLIVLLLVKPSGLFGVDVQDKA